MALHLDPVRATELDARVFLVLFQFDDVDGVVPHRDVRAVELDPPSGSGVDRILEHFHSWPPRVDREIVGVAAVLADVVAVDLPVCKNSSLRAADQDIVIYAIDGVARQPQEPILSNAVANDQTRL